MRSGAIQRKKRLNSCPHIPQPSESNLLPVSHYKPEPKHANYIPACACSAKSPKGLRDLRWDLGAWMQSCSPQSPFSAVPKARRHLRTFSQRSCEGCGRPCSGGTPSKSLIPRGMEHGKGEGWLWKSMAKQLGSSPGCKEKHFPCSVVCVALNCP